MNLTLDQLRELCRQYDVHQGNYPEHKYEGWSVFNFIQKLLSGTDPYKDYKPGDYDDSPQDWPDK